MSKAKKRKRIIKRDEGRIERHEYSTGIYKTTSACATDPAAMKALVVDLNNAVKKQQNIDYQLIQIEKHAKAVLASHGVTEWSKNVPVVPRKAPPVVKDAADIFVILPSFKKFIKHSKSRREAALMGMRLGAAYERMSIRWLEPATKYAI